MGEACGASYTPGEEIANTLTHAAAALLSAAGLAVLVTFAALDGAGAMGITACAIFGASMILLYTTSALYHGIQSKRMKAFFQVLDHAMIYVLIAGSYTPFCLVTLYGSGGAALCVFEWALAAAGVSMQRVLMKKSALLNCAIYLAMGWAILPFIGELVDRLSGAGLFLLALGGVVYSLGVIFYIWERIPFNHALWHLFVLAGTALQFFAVLFYVLP